MSIISVIVPIYGVEEYLDRCVQSIVDQTYSNLEIILVDDGSPDKCPAMCDAWAEKDTRIKVIHKKNGGLSDARNAGMAVATGELIGFVDSDDWISPNMYQLLYDDMCHNGSDISCCGIQMVWENSEAHQMLTMEGDIVLANEEAMISLIQESWLKHPVVNRLYKKECVKGVCFPYKRLHEDVFWGYQVIANANKVSIIGETGYFYLQRDGSIMGQDFSIKRLDMFDAYYEELRFIQNRYPSMSGKAVAIFGSRLLYAYQCVFKIPDKKEQAQCLERLSPLCAYWKKYKVSGEPDGSKAKFWYAGACASITITAKIRNKLKVGW